MLPLPLPLPPNQVTPHGFVKFMGSGLGRKMLARYERNGGNPALTLTPALALAPTPTLALAQTLTRHTLAQPLPRHAARQQRGSP